MATRYASSAPGKRRRPSKLATGGGRTSSHESGFSNLVPIVGRGIHAQELNGGHPLKATYAWVDANSVFVRVDDGRQVSAPLEWYPRLKHGTPSERNDWRLVMAGRVILWPSLRIGISVKALLEGERHHEPASEWRRWLNERKSIKLKRSA